MTLLHENALCVDQAEPDMFGPEPVAATPTGPRLQFTGTLAHDAEVRSKPVDHGTRVVPVLCLDLRVGQPAHTLRAEQLYTEATHADAERVARTLKRGQVVCLTTSLLDMRVFLPHVESIFLDSQAQ